MNIPYLALLVLISATQLPAQSPAIPEVGMPAPRFTLPYATRDSVARNPLDVAELIGMRTIVLAFYPADWSPGCTKELCSFRDNFARLQELDAEILAISGDYVWSHHAWAKHHDLPFKLLSDHDHAVARLYSSFNEKTQFNRRTVFVIDRNGTVAYVDLAYNVADTAAFERLKEALGIVR